MRERRTPRSLARVSSPVAGFAVLIAFAIVLTAVAAGGPAAAVVARTVRASVGPAGVQGDGFSSDPAISADGRFVAFASGASNLVSGDTNGAVDVFVRDRSTARTFLVSASSAGTPGNSFSSDPAISADGRFVAFSSDASNLVPGDTNGAVDVFVRNRAARETVRVSVSSAGSEGNMDSGRPALSANGRYVSFQSASTNLNASGDTNGKVDIFLHDRLAGTTLRASVTSRRGQANGSSYEPALSADGRFVAFSSESTNLTGRADTNEQLDVFVRDRSRGRTSRVSVTWKGRQANGFSQRPAISADGRFIAFQSAATNLNSSGDTNRALDVFVRDRTRRTTSRVSVTSKGEQSRSDSYWPAVSASGRIVAFYSRASNLVRSDSNAALDVFVRDRSEKTTTRASLTSDGAQGEGHSSQPALSADLRFIAFASHASNLVRQDTNSVEDVFIRGLSG